MISMRLLRFRSLPPGEWLSAALAGGHDPLAVDAA